MGSVKDKLIDKMVKHLSKEGKRLAKRAAETKETENRSFNQQDAFGYVVYYKGEAKAKGYANDSPKAERAHRGWDKIGVSAGTGREWLDDFMGTWKPKSDGFVLIVVNAAFYSVIQEEGRGSLHHKFRIISQLKDDMTKIQKNYRGATTTVTTLRPK